MQELANLLSRARREGILTGEPIHILPSTNGVLNNTIAIEYADGRKQYWKRFESRPDLPWLESPEDRMGVEIRALNAFRDVLAPYVKLPIVLLTDETSNWLLLSDACPIRGGNWQQAFLEGDPEISILLARKLGLAFANLAHSLPIKSLRSSFDSDATHWNKWLRLRTIETLKNDPPISIHAKHSLSELYEEGFTCTRRCLLHIDFGPKNIVISPNAAGLVDFELSTSVGDPPFEFGYFLGHIGLLLVNKKQSMNLTWLNILDQIIISYLASLQLDVAQQQRVMRYAGAAILYRIAGVLRGTFLNPHAIARQLDFAQNLLTGWALIHEYPILLGHYCDLQPSR